MGNGVSVQHKSLAAGRWKQLSFIEQMANIGSEVSRALNWQNKDNEYSHRAVNRALELMSLTLDDIKVRSHYKELARLHEALVDYFYGENRFSSSEPLWRKYFDHFAYAARKNR